MLALASGENVRFAIEGVACVAADCCFCLVLVLRVSNFEQTVHFFSLAGCRSPNAEEACLAAYRDGVCVNTVLVQREMERGRSPLASIARVSAGLSCALEGS
jgi:hypothetical protein